MGHTMTQWPSPSLMDEWLGGSLALRLAAPGGQHHVAVARRSAAACGRAALTAAGGSIPASPGRTRARGRRSRNFRPAQPVRSERNAIRLHLGCAELITILALPAR